MPVVIIHKEKLAQGTPKKNSTTIHMRATFIKYDTVRIIGSYEKRLLGGRWGWRGWYNLVPRAFPLKNRWKSPGDEVGGGRLIATKKLIKFHLLHPIQ